MSRICPTFIAFKGPADAGPNRPDYALLPEDFLQRFERAGVSDVVQLNEGHYSTDVYVEVGMRHHRMPFTDCATPSVDIVARFLQVHNPQPETRNPKPEILSSNSKPKTLPATLTPPLLSSLLYCSHA